MRKFEEAGDEQNESKRWEEKDLFFIALDASLGPLFMILNGE